jgi:hypothetical protein
MKCPFVYANGRHCSGEIYRARAYGRHDRYGIVEEHNIRKIRLWCSEKDDHSGAVSSYESKQRMEFYPDQLQRIGLIAEAIALCDNVPRAQQAGFAPGAAVLPAEPGK